jgi:hypothetical protein
MSEVRRLERMQVEVMEPLVDGTYKLTSVEKYGWLCLGCGLAWGIKWHAEQCEDRGHVGKWEQVYHRGPSVNGVPERTFSYPRVALGSVFPPAAEAPARPRAEGIPLGVSLTPDGEWRLTSPTGRSVDVPVRLVVEPSLARRLEAATLDCRPAHVSREEMAALHRASQLREAGL